MKNKFYQVWVRRPWIDIDEFWFQREVKSLKKAKQVAVRIRKGGEGVHTKIIKCEVVDEK